MNKFKSIINNEKCAIGSWVATANPYIAEMSASIGYDWLLIDGEHGPNNLHSILAQLQSTSSYTSEMVVRINDDNPSLIKQVLDIGATSILVPMINNVEQALNLIKSVKYPPVGNRGVGAYIARASLWGQNVKYLSTANDDICVIIQIETIEAVKNLEKILTNVDIDGIFIGPADLAASMGYIEDINNINVKNKIKSIINTAKLHNIPVGTICTNDDEIKSLINDGIDFIAVSIDTVSLIDSLQEKLNKVKEIC